MARARSRKPHSIAIAGSGASSFANTKDLLDDLLGFQNEIPEDDASRILVVVAGEFMEGLSSVVQWLDDWMLAYDILLEDRNPDEFDGAPTSWDVDEVISNADNVYKMSAYVKQMSYAGAIANWFEERDGDNRAKIILWDDSVRSDELTAIVKQQYDARSFDLTSGLDAIEIEDEDPVNETPGQAVVRGELKEVEEPLTDDTPPREIEVAAEVAEEITETPAEVGANDPTSIGTWTQFQGEYQSAKAEEYVAAEAEAKAAGESYRADKPIPVASNIEGTITISRAELQQYLTGAIDPAVVPLLINSVDNAISQLTLIRQYLGTAPEQGVKTLFDTVAFLGGTPDKDTPGVEVVSVEEPPAPKRRGRPRKVTT